MVKKPQKSNKPTNPRHFATTHVTKEFPELTDHAQRLMLKNLLTLAADPSSSALPDMPDAKPVTHKELIKALLELHKQKAIDLTARRIDETGFLSDAHALIKAQREEEAQTKRAAREHRPRNKPWADSGIREYALRELFPSRSNFERE